MYAGEVSAVSQTTGIIEQILKRELENSVERCDYDRLLVATADGIFSVKVSQQIPGKPNDATQQPAVRALAQPADESQA